jgi:hypothetical protein
VTPEEQRRDMRAIAVALALAPALLGCPSRGSARDNKPPAILDSAAEAAADEASAPDAGPAKEALPAFPSDDLTTRARHLLEAIAKDDPSLATDIVFPRDAYIEAKDAVEPGKQWDNKVMGAFQKQVHALHKRTNGAPRAQFVSFEIGQPISQVVPKKHDMVLTLWRVRHCRLDFTIDGKPMRFDLAELMSWKGAWYVLDLR